MTLFQASDPLEKHWYYEPGVPTPDDWYNRDSQHGWGRLAGGGLEIHDVPGEHLTMLKESRHVEFLAEKLRACLDKANSLET